MTPRRTIAALALSVFALAVHAQPASAPAPSPASASASAALGGASDRARGVPQLSKAQALPLRRDDDATPASAYAAWLAVLLIAAGGFAVVRAARKGWTWRTSAHKDITGSLAVLQSRALGPQATLHVVRWHGREYLLAQSAGAVTVVDTRSPDAAP